MPLNDLDTPINFPGSATSTTGPGMGGTMEVTDAERKGGE